MLPYSHRQESSPENTSDTMGWLDRLAAELLAPLAIWVFANGLDDLILDLAFVFYWIRSRLSRPPPSPVPRTLGPAREQRIALLIPCWQEAAVIEKMLSHNLAVIDYHNYDVWVGVYPNDPETRSRVEDFELRFRSVHHAVCPHDGPTTKADCLNWIFQAVAAHERRTGERYGVVVQHDAEDLIHPRAFTLINEQTLRYDMVQVPVFPLATPAHELTHGTYCDEFAEFHLKELYVRTQAGGFLPSAGVGTAYRRDALDRLLASHGGWLFDPQSLTEDYFAGLELHRQDASQMLLHPFEVPGAPAQGARVRPNGGQRGHERFVATREYFPHGFAGAVRQRTRWITGIALQSWQRFGWRAGPGQIYWLWRDRKALINHPVSVLANLVCAYGLAGWAWASWQGAEWALGAAVSDPSLLVLLKLNLAAVCWRQAVRAGFAWRVYGWRHALLAPGRAPWANLINFAATVRALQRFAAARLAGRPLSWSKTAHAYPSAQPLPAGPRRLGDILVSLRMISRSDLEECLRLRRAGETLGETLLRLGALSEPDLYEALSLQQRLPFWRLDPAQVDRAAAGLLPATLRERWRVIPLGFEEGSMRLATPDPPSEGLRRVLDGFGGGKSRVVLITPSNYRRLQAAASSALAEGGLLEPAAGD